MSVKEQSGGDVHFRRMERLFYVYLPILHLRVHLKGIFLPVN